MVSPFTPYIELFAKGTAPPTHIVSDEAAM